MHTIWIENLGQFLREIKKSFWVCFVSDCWTLLHAISVTRNVYKSCLKMISLEKLYSLTPLQKLPKNVGDLDTLIVAKGFKKLPKVQ